MIKSKKLTRGDFVSQTDISDAALIAYMNGGKPTGNFKCPLNESTWIKKVGAKLHAQKSDDLRVELNSLLSRTGGPVYIYKKPPTAGVYAKVSMTDADLRKILRRKK